MNFHIPDSKTLAYSWQVLCFFLLFISEYYVIFGPYWHKQSLTNEKHRCLNCPWPADQCFNGHEINLAACIGQTLITRSKNIYEIM